jgi:hypothetical protein
MANSCSSQGVVQGFRAKYCELCKAQIIILESRNNLGRNSGWFCQKPFGSPKSVVEYLGRYKIAISNHRIQSVNDQNVTFGYKDYRVNGQKSMSLTGEFIRRFSCIFAQTLCKNKALRFLAVLGNVKAKAFATKN